MKYLVLILLLFIFTGPLSAFDTPYSFPDTTALGNAEAADSGGMSSILHNPSAISRIDYYGLQVMTSDLYGMGFNVLSLAYVNPLRFGTLGIFVGLISSSDMPVTDVYRYPRSGGQTGEGMVLSSSEAPSVLGYYNENRSLIFLSYGFPIQKFDIGVSVKRYSHGFGGDVIEDKYINAVVHSSANAYGLDLGVIYHVTASLDMGLCSMDILNTSLDWGTQYEYTEVLPRRIALGFKAGFFNGRLKVLAEAEKRSDDKQVLFGAGLDYRLLKYFDLRIGASSQNLFSTGLGINYEISRVMEFFGMKGNKAKWVALDYSVSLLSSIGTTHKFSLVFRFF